MTLQIRDAQPQDQADWLKLWTDYLAFYNVDLAEDVTAHTWARIMDPASRLSMRLAVLDGQTVGDGKPGAVYAALYAAYQRAKARAANEALAQRNQTIAAASLQGVQ